eukprot:3244616-Amphidinium_carterae.2
MVLAAPLRGHDRGKGPPDVEKDKGPNNCMPSKGLLRGYQPVFFQDCKRLLPGLLFPRPTTILLNLAKRLICLLYTSPSPRDRG